MQMRRAARLLPIGLGALLLVSGCGSVTAPDPVLQTENFSGTLQPLGSDFKTFTIAYSQSATNLSVTVNTLTSIATSTPVTGIKIGVGFGTLSGTTCALQVQTPVADLGVELSAPNGASSGTYCVQIFDCPTGTTGCTSTLTEAVSYAMTVKHY